jgi:hypothetical protein
MAKKKATATKSKAAKSKAAKPKAAKPKAKKPAKTTKAAGGKRVNWVDPDAQTPLLNEYARQMSSFVQALSDGVVEESEIAEQEKQVVALMKEIEPKLSDDLHDKITRLLCEVTVYDMMQLILSLQKERMRTTFQG